jgi:hypothetical protein
MKKYDKFVNESKSTPHSYGCCMVKFDVPTWKTDFLDIIKKEDIYDVDGFGLETETHVTLLYGIYNEVKIDDILTLLPDIDDFYCIFNTISIFSNGEYDVLKLEADAEWLYEINLNLRSNLPYKETFGVYNPHMTIAYLKAGRGTMYMKNLEKPLILKPSEIYYSYSINDKNIQKTMIKSNGI